MKYDFRIKKYPGHCAQERLIIATERIVLGQWRCRWRCSLISVPLAPRLPGFALSATMEWWNPLVPGFTRPNLGSVRAEAAPSSCGGFSAIAWRVCVHVGMKEPAQQLVTCRNPLKEGPWWLPVSRRAARCGAMPKLGTLFCTHLEFCMRCWLQPSVHRLLRYMFVVRCFCSRYSFLLGSARTYCLKNLHNSLSLKWR